jgi:hypothetical protein
VKDVWQPRADMPIAACAYAATVGSHVYVFVFGKVGLPPARFMLYFRSCSAHPPSFDVPAPLTTSSECSSTTQRRTRIAAALSSPSRSGTVSPPRWREPGEPRLTPRSKMQQNAARFFSSPQVLGLCGARQNLRARWSKSGQVDRRGLLLRHHARHVAPLAQHAHRAEKD